MKDETRVHGPWSDKVLPAPWQLKPLLDGGLFDWQMDVMNSHSWPKSRVINVFWDETGKHGKSTFCNSFSVLGVAMQFMSSIR